MDTDKKSPAGDAISVAPGQRKAVAWGKSEHEIWERRRCDISVTLQDDQPILTHNVFD